MKHNNRYCCSLIAGLFKSASLICLALCFLLRSSLLLSAVDIVDVQEPDYSKQSGKRIGSLHPMTSNDSISSEQDISSVSSDSSLGDSEAWSDLDSNTAQKVMDELHEYHEVLNQYLIKPKNIFEQYQSVVHEISSKYDNQIRDVEKMHPDNEQQLVDIFMQSKAKELEDAKEKFYHRDLLQSSQSIIDTFNQHKHDAQMLFKKSKIRSSAAHKLFVEGIAETVTHEFDNKQTLRDLMQNIEQYDNTIKTAQQDRDMALEPIKKALRKKYNISNEHEAVGKIKNGIKDFFNPSGRAERMKAQLAKKFEKVKNLGLDARKKLINNSVNELYDDYTYDFQKAQKKVDHFQGRLKRLQEASKGKAVSSRVQEQEKELRGDIEKTWDHIHVIYNGDPATGKQGLLSHFIMLASDVLKTNTTGLSLSNPTRVVEGALDIVEQSKFNIMRTRL